MNKLRLMILLISVSFLLKTYSQVTIGSTEKPQEGVILQLNNINEENNSSVNANKGLGLPRVNLTSADNLFPMFAKEDGSANSDYNTQNKKDVQDAHHVGLVVYNTNNCTIKGKGLYVWDGTTWDKIPNEGFSSGFNFNKTYFDLPSGADLRSLEAQSLVIDWHLDNRNLTYDKNNTLNGGLSFSGANALQPTFTTSPATINLLPDPLSIDKDSPWVSKETELVFTDSDCEDAKYVITLNQTNFALQANNAFTNNVAIFMNSQKQNFPLQSNAVWKTSKSDQNDIFVSTEPIIGAVNGQDIKNGTSDNTSFQYTPKVGERHDYQTIKFEDAEQVKRFQDINVTIMNCEDKTEPTLEQWAERLGYNAAEITAVKNGSAPLDGGRSSVIKNGYQLHVDQDGNLFISSQFGLDAKSTDGTNRWMIVNLSAKKLEHTGRTGDDKIVHQEFHPSSPEVILGLPTAGALWWCYPNEATSSTTYDRMNRLGLLYNWSAATNSKGTYTLDGTLLDIRGRATIDDGEDQSTPQTTKIQGVCPNGWHLPSDVEFTELEEEINANTSQYSFLVDANATIEKGTLGRRGTTHGQAIKDPCPVPGISSAPNGASHVMSSTVKAGFSFMLTGYSNGNHPGNFGIDGSMWSSSGSKDVDAWSRNLRNTQGELTRRTDTRSFMFSIRCKKD